MSPSASSSGVELSAVFNPVFFGGYSEFAQQLKRMLAEAGFSLKQQNETFEEFNDAESNGKTDVSMGRWIADYPDADSFIYQLHSQQGFLGRLCGSPDLDRLVESGRVETDPAARHAIYREVEKIIAREALLIPLFHEQVYRFARPEVEGLTVSFWGGIVSYENLRIRA